MHTISVTAHGHGFTVTESGHVTRSRHTVTGSRSRSPATAHRHGPGHGLRSIVVLIGDAQAEANRAVVGVVLAEFVVVVGIAGVGGARGPVVAHAFDEVDDLEAVVLVDLGGVVGMVEDVVVGFGLVGQGVGGAAAGVERQVAVALGIDIVIHKLDRVAWAVV